MNTASEHNSTLEAAPAACKPSAELGGFSQACEVSGQLPPGQNRGTDSVSPAPASKSPSEMRAKIMALEAAMLKLPQLEIKTTHHFAPGVYMREIFIPKGTTLTGKIHKTEHLNILSQGKLSVWTEDGIKTLTASTVIKSNPGIKRVGYAHEDSVWITVHHNADDARDVDLIEERLIAKTFEEALEFAAPKQIAGGK